MLNWATEPEIELRIDKKVGHLRFDFTDDGLSNVWFGEGLLDEYRTEIDAKLTEIIKTMPDYDFIVDLCGGEGVEKSANRFATSDNFIYWVNFIPVIDNYHYYVHVYKK